MQKITHIATGTLYELVKNYEGRSDFEGSAIHKGIQSEINERDRGTLREKLQGQIDGAHNAANKERATVANLKLKVKLLEETNALLSVQLEELKK